MLGVVGAAVDRACPNCRDEARGRRARAFANVAVALAIAGGGAICFGGLLAVRVFDAPASTRGFVMLRAAEVLAAVGGPAMAFGVVLVVPARLVAAWLERRARRAGPTAMPGFAYRDDARPVCSRHPPAKRVDADNRPT